MDEDRRLYGFFHKGVSNDLVAFVEVALIKGRCGSVQELLDVTALLGDAKAADRAIFYLINNVRKGLVRNSSGGLLIKALVGELQKQFPNWLYFSTLSPIPGFCDWLEDRLKDGEGADFIVRRKDRNRRCRRRRKTVFRLLLGVVLARRRQSGTGFESAVYALAPSI